MSETISMTDILLTVSVGCNLWFLFLLLYDRIMETRLVRFLRSIAGVVGRHGGKARSGKGNTARRHPGHHRQEPFQDGIDPDNRCHTDARSRHFGKRH